MYRALVFVIILSIAGCSYGSKNNAKITGKDMKFNPLTRTVSGKELKVEINSNRQIGFLKPHPQVGIGAGAPDKN